MKSIKNIISILIISVSFLFTLILIKILKPFNYDGIKLLCGYLILMLILYKLWIITTYGFVCKNCGYEFKIGLLKRISNFKNKRSCPICNSKILIKEGITNYYFEDWIDIDDD